MIAKIIGISETRSFSPEQVKIFSKIFAFFYSFLVATTIGYGSITPNTDSGKLFCIFFTMIGIPYFAYMISVIAELINNVITWAKSRITGISITGLYITGGTIFMIVIPAKIFVVVEGKIKNGKKKIYFF